MFVLDGERYRAAKEKLRDEYAKLHVRNASHAGQAYPETKEKLEIYLDGILDLKESGPGAEKRRVRAIVARTSIRTRAKKRTPKLMEHYPERLPAGRPPGDGAFSRRRLLFAHGKGLQNPLGLVRTDKAAVKKLREAGAGVIAPDDLAHRRDAAPWVPAHFSSATLRPVLLDRADPSAVRSRASSQSRPRLPGPWSEGVPRRLSRFVGRGRRRRIGRRRGRLPPTSDRSSDTAGPRRPCFPKRSGTARLCSRPAWPWTRTPSGPKRAG